MHQTGVQTSRVAYIRQTNTTQTRPALTANRFEQQKYEVPSLRLPVLPSYKSNMHAGWCENREMSCARAPLASETLSVQIGVTDPLCFRYFQYCHNYIVRLKQLAPFPCLLAEMSWTADQLTPVVYVLHIV